MREYRVSIFKSIFDVSTKKHMDFETWDDTVKLFKQLLTQPHTKKTAPLINSAVFKEGTTRSNNNVEYWSRWCAVDVDSLLPEPGKDLEDQLEQYCGDYNYFCYSSASSTIEHPKFRLIFPLTDVVMAHEIPHFWFALNKQLKEIGDRQTKDASRMFYIPAKYENAHNFSFEVTDRQELNPKQLMSKWEFKKQTGNSFLDRLPDELREEVIAHRKRRTTKDTKSWTSYANCPYFPKRLSMEYRVISGTGWYHKLYQIMVATASNAIKDSYPITAKEIAMMCKQLDAETGNWYDNRPLEREADGAIEWVYRNL